MPRRGPALTLSEEVQVYEAACDEGIDPGTGVGVEVDDEFVRFTSRRSHEDYDSYDPVEEELDRCYISILCVVALGREYTEAAGALQGLLEAQNLLKGMIPSFANSAPLVSPPYKHPQCYNKEFLP